MINKMVWTGLTQRKIIVANPQIRRPILGIDDLCRAMELIAAGDDRPGIYNLCSFNTTVGEVARTVAEIIGCELEEGPPSSTYDFSMENGKIELEYAFRPQESVSTIVQGLFGSMARSEWKTFDETLRRNGPVPRLWRRQSGNIS